MAMVSPSSFNLPSEQQQQVEGVEQKNYKMNEEKHFKEIIQQATYEILYF